MTNLLLGLGDVIADAFGNVLTKILTPLIQLALDFILLPILELLFTIISYVLGLVGFYCGAFILKLIDFVEVLFRALAGLESTGNTGMSMSLSLDGQSGDILIQLIRNKDIQQAFLAMCIVGLFLLVVTSVFQIIKVEYTTEGSKNAKGPIFNKAFRGLCNLMLIPILVIFGIFMANQVLGLIDKATSVQGENPTISGLIFVASASEAHYLDGEDFTCFAEENSEVGNIYLTNAMLQALGDAVDEWLESLGKEDSNISGVGDSFKNASTIDQIEKSFISQSEGHKYYNLVQVSSYYNYSRINYFLMLFGGVFALKCLFFTSFGLVIRLYKCAILFIISPMIIGWSPVSDNLGKWRSSFIGQVLAAYGTVLSINLFFVVIRVLLNIEISFTAGKNALVNSLETGAFTSSFMTLLLKCIFVLAGCLMIEKFSKELGGYFGAEDAMSAGKDMANQVGDLAMKGVATAAMIGTGGAALAMKGVSGIKSVGSGIANKVNTFKSGSEEGGGFKGGMSALWQDSKISKSMSAKHGKQIEEADAAKERANVAGKKADAFELALKNVSNSEKDQDAVFENQKKNLEKRGYDVSKIKTIDDLRSAASDSAKVAAKSERKAEELKNKTSTFDRDRDLGNLSNKRAKEEKNKEKISRFAINMGSAMYGFAEEGKGNLPFKNIRKKFTDAEKNGAEMLGDNFKTAYDVTHKDKKDHKTEKDTAEKIFGAPINTINLAGSKIVLERLGSAAEETEKKEKKQIKDNIEYFQNAYQNTATQEGKSRIVEQFNKYAFDNKLTIDFKDSESILSGQNQAKFDDIMSKFNGEVSKKIKEIVKDIKSKGNVSIEEIQEAIKKEFEGSNEKTMKKLLEEIKKITDDLSK